MVFGVSLWILSASVLFKLCAAQEACYPAGGVAGIVVATIIVTVVVGGLGTAVAWKLWTRKKGNNRDHVDGQHHQKQSQKSSDFAFDNPYFKDPEADDGDLGEKGKARSSINNKNSLRSSKVSDLSSKGKKSKSGKNHFMFGGGGGKKHRALDDSCLAVEPERTIVSLRGHDFTGLGFNICGNMRDGILVKDVLHRGPASESGLIKAGDKIVSVTVSFTNIVYEDALTILSYASPYDVQLEIERIPDKARAIPTTPSGSKRLGSCSFNNSGQKLFHPLYRSQSIDDLTQIDKDTFPSHGLGPRRSQSVGVAAHKLAAHFKNSDTKLEDKDRTSAPLILSTTGSLNEKMLANVIADGNLHKNGLQWEKKFEDTLESEDSNHNTAAGNEKTKSHLSKSGGILKDSTSNADNTSDSSDETTKKSQIFAKKNLKYLDSPHNKGKLEMYKSPSSKSNEDPKAHAQTHQLERLSGRRAKTMAEASNALWQLDQSIKDGDVSISDLDSSCNSSWNSPQKAEFTSNKNSTPDVKSHRFQCREEDNDSDVSHDSLEFCNKRKGNKKCKKTMNSHANEAVAEDSVTHDKSGISDNMSSVHKQNYQQKSSKKNMQHNDLKNKGHTIEMTSKSDYPQNLERIYANNMLNKSTSLHSNMPNINTEEIMDEREKECYFDIRDTKHPPDLILHAKKECDHKQPAVYANQREMHEKSNRNAQKNVVNESVSGYNKVNGRSVYGEKQKLNTVENFSQSYGCNNRVVVNGETDEQKSKYISNSKNDYSQKTTQMYHKTSQEELTKNESDIRLTESKNKSNQKFVKKSSNPAGMFTQINPFQQPSRQKNANFKVWTGREDINKDPSGNRSDHQFTSNTYISACDSSGVQSRRENATEAQSYGQRQSDTTKTVLISSYDSSAARSMQNNSHALNYRQHK